MASLYSTQSSNIWKTWILMSVFFVFIIFLGWFLSYYYQSPNILIIAVLFSFGMNFFSYWFSDKIVLSISGAHEASKEQYYDLYTSVENLAITSGLPMPKVYVIEDPSPNAFATGRNEKHATVAFTTGLLAILNKAELEGVIAHELAHIKNKDILLQSVVVVLVGLITLLSDFFIRSTFFGGRDRDSKAGGVLLIIGIVLLILSPIVGVLMQLAISRKREFLADATGALMTRYPDGLASALNKISRYARPMQRANHATAHLFISDPYKEQDEEGHEKISLFHKLFLTHPPVEERVNSLLGKK
jgi:heat shock protein HtpX